MAKVASDADLCYNEGLILLSLRDVRAPLRRVNNLLRRLSTMDTLPPHAKKGKPSPETTFIYALIDPSTQQIRYVGKSDDPKDRLRRHLGDGANIHKTRWIAKLKRQGLIPLLHILEEVPYSQWQEKERYWIAYYREQGCSLLNKTDGGDGLSGYEYTDEIRKKMSLRQMGRKRSEGSRKQQAQTWAERYGKTFDVISPEGIEYKGINNVRDFCREHGLISMSFSQMLRGELNHHKGWKRLDSDYKPKAFAFIAPDGTIYRDIERLDFFCEEHGLSYKSMSALHRGKSRTALGGWMKYVPEAEQVLPKVLNLNNTSGYRGVFRYNGCWKAQINGKFIGAFNNPKMAAQAYDRAAIELYGNKAVTNFAAILYDNKSIREDPKQIPLEPIDKHNVHQLRLFETYDDNDATERCEE